MTLFRVDLTNAQHKLLRVTAANRGTYMSVLVVEYIMAGLAVDNKLTDTPSTIVDEAHAELLSHGPWSAEPCKLHFADLACRKCDNKGQVILDWKLTLDKRAQLGAWCALCGTWIKWVPGSHPAYDAAPRLTEDLL